MQMFPFYKGFDFLFGDDSSAITFIANQNNNGRLIGITLHFVDPVVLDGVEWVPVGQVEDQIHSMGIYDR